MPTNRSVHSTASKERMSRGETNTLGNQATNVATMSKTTGVLTRWSKSRITSRQGLQKNRDMDARMRRIAKTEWPNATEGMATPNRNVNRFGAVDKGSVRSII